MITKFKLPNNIQIIPFESKPRNEKWLLPSIYKPPFQNNQYFASSLTDLLVFCSCEYDNKVVLGDFNLDTSSPSMLTLMNSHNFVNLIKKLVLKEQVPVFTRYWQTENTPSKILFLT